MGIITFFEFSQWGTSSYNGTKQPRFTVKDDVTFIKGSHTIKTGFTYDRQQANGFGQQDYGGRAGFDFKHTGVPGVTNFATAGGSSFAFVPSRLRQLGPNRDDSSCSRSIRPAGSTPRTIGVLKTESWSSTTDYGTSSRGRQSRAAIGIRSSIRTCQTRVSTAILARSFSPVKDLAVRASEASSTVYYGAIAPRLSGAYSIPEQTTLRGGIGRSYGRVTVISGTSHFAGFIGRSEFTNTDSGLTPTFLLDQGLPSYPLPPQIDPAFSNNTRGSITGTGIRL